MSLHNVKLIVGGHGSGKSNWIYNYFFSNAVKKCDDGKERIDLDKKFFLIVPEQDTNDKQRLLMTESGKRNLGFGIINMDVVSFDRIAHNVFSYLNIEPEKESVIEDDAKTMILSLALSKLHKEKKLKYYNKMLGKFGFARKLTQVVSEFYAYNIKNEDIEKVIKSTKNDILKSKLSDLSILYDEFVKVIKDKGFSIKEDKYDLLNKNIDKVDIFDDAVVAFDGFTGFTPVQMEIFEKIVKKAKEVYVSIDIRCEKNDLDSITHTIGDKSDTFNLSKIFINDISKALSDIGEELLTSDFIYIDGCKKYENKKDFLHLEKNVYSYKKNIDKIASENISIYSCKNADDEVRNLVEKIKELTDTGYSYNDIKVVVPSVEEYSDLMIKTFNKHSIPLFIDDSKGLLNSPYIETIRAALDVIIYDFSYDSVMRYINSGLIEKTDLIDMLDNIIIKYGIRGYKRYKFGFDKINIADKYKDSIVALKEEIFTPLFNLYEKINKKSTIDTFTNAITDFISEIKLNEKFEAFISAFDEKVSNDNDYKRESSILSESIKTVDNTIKNICIINKDDNDTIDLSDYKKLLDIGFSERKVKSIPYLLDQVVVGDVMRSRFDNPKVLFMLGLNQSKVPASSSDVSIIDDRMRDEFSAKNIKLSQTSFETTLNQRFYIYLTLTNPTEKLVLSYPRINIGGDSDERSPILLMIQNLYEKLEEKVVDFDDDIVSKPLLLENEDLDKNLAVRLIDRNSEGYRGSVSAIEKFNSCPYKYFLENSMSLSPRETFDIEPLDMGNFFHKVMELIYKKGFDIKKIDDKYATDLVNEAIDTIEKDEKHKLDKFTDFSDKSMDFYGSHKIEFIKERAKKVLVSALKALSKIENKSKLQCKETERKFEYDIDGDKFTGKIDKIESYEEDNKIYINIIDYKSGKKTITIDEIEAGVKIQLLLYLDYCLSDDYKEAKGTISCGSFYFRIADPVIKIDTLEEKKELDNMKMKELSYVGIMNDDEDVIHKIKEDLSAKKALKGENAGKTTSYNDKDGFSLRGIACDSDELKTAIENMHEKIKESISCIKSGNIKIKPYDKSDCDYCPYSTICRIDQAQNIEKVQNED